LGAHSPLTVQLAAQHDRRDPVTVNPRPRGHGGQGHSRPNQRSPLALRAGSQKIIVEMPDNATTKSCDHGRHDHCVHRLGGPAEGGVLLKLGLPGFLWRCGCPCHRDPHRAGRLF